MSPELTELRETLLMECARLEEECEFLETIKDAPTPDLLRFGCHNEAYRRVVRLIEYGLPLSAPAEA